MSPAEALAQLPDDTPVSLTVGAGTMTIGDLKAAWASSVVFITTEEAAARFSRSPEYWAGKARDGEIPGAVKDAVWRLPLQEVERYATRPTRARRRRGPWSKATPPQAARAGAENMETR